MWSNLGRLVSILVALCARAEGLFRSLECSTCRVESFVGVPGGSGIGLRTSELDFGKSRLSSTSSLACQLPSSDAWSSFACLSYHAWPILPTSNMGRTSTTCHVSTTSFLGFWCPVRVSAHSFVVYGRSPGVSRVSELVGASSTLALSSSCFESIASASTPRR
ncbi:hypothetical protein EDD16DRAFT_180090 [Pisolithus croceorrhizus]|nr:hypothetical protein EDD16DRAFT_180090 [Pisolithus croceorrhizus]KAI6163446.1 hypothetical protein EDD17DRAFT_496801 [Pisolithus thermaeus]